METVTTEQDIPSPFRALLWKEFRQHWVSVAAAMAAVNGFVAALATSEYGDSLPELALFFYAGTGLLIGAGMAAPEHDDKTVLFLEALPCKPVKLWFAKLILAFLAVVLVCQSGMIVFGLFHPKICVGQTFFWSSLSCFLTLMFSLGMFGAGLFASTLYSNPVLAFLIGAPVGVASHVAALLMTSESPLRESYHVSRLLEEPQFWTYPGVFVVMAVASYLAYVRCDRSRGRVWKTVDTVGWTTMAGILPAMVIFFGLAVWHSWIVPLFRLWIS